MGVFFLDAKWGVSDGTDAIGRILQPRLSSDITYLLHCPYAWKPPDAKTAKKIIYWNTSELSTVEISGRSSEIGHEHSIARTDRRYMLSLFRFLFRSFSIEQVVFSRSFMIKPVNVQAIRILFAKGLLSNTKTTFHVSRIGRDTSVMEVLCCSLVDRKWCFDASEVNITTDSTSIKAFEINQRKLGGIILDAEPQVVSKKAIMYDVCSTESQTNAERIDGVVSKHEGRMRLTTPELATMEVEKEITAPVIRNIKNVRLLRRHFDAFVPPGEGIFRDKELLEKTNRLTFIDIFECEIYSPDVSYLLARMTELAPSLVWCNLRVFMPASMSIDCRKFSELLFKALPKAPNLEKYTLDWRDLILRGTHLVSFLTSNENSKLELHLSFFSLSMSGIRLSQSSLVVEKLIANTTLMQLICPCIISWNPSVQWYYRSNAAALLRYISTRNFLGRGGSIIGRCGGDDAFRDSSGVRNGNVTKDWEHIQRHEFSTLETDLGGTWDGSSKELVCLTTLYICLKQKLIFPFSTH